MSNRRLLRKDTSVYLIGNYSPQIVGSKLPSIKQVLTVLFFNLREVRLTIRQSSKLVIDEVIIFWNKARIPTREVQHCIKKVEDLYYKWSGLQKNCKRRTETQLKNEEIFVQQFDNLFDIAHENALTIMDLTEDKEFLINQRKKGREGHMYGLDTVLAAKEKRKEEREKAYVLSKKRSHEEMELLGSSVSDFISSSESSDDEDDLHEEEGRFQEGAASTSPEPKNRRSAGRKNIITEKLVAALDKCKVSDRDAVHLITAVAEALEFDIHFLSISRTTIQRCRQSLRKQIAEKRKLYFHESNFTAPVVHWDSKLLSVLGGSATEDRLAIIITDGNIEQIIGIPVIPNSSGREQAHAVFEVLLDWDMADKVKALCCDTTASNFGRVNGACNLLEQMLERDLFYLPCRHHIYELILKSAFDKLMPPSSGPDVPLFKRFKQSWSKIDSTKIMSAMQLTHVQEIFKNDITEILSFADNVLKTQLPRHDYNELLQLTLLFLGRSSKVPVRAPGAIHHARWMAKAIYCLKIFLYRDQFNLTTLEQTSILQLCIFIVKLYIKAWFTAPFAHLAPYHDLQFFKKLILFKEINREIADTAVLKFKNHTWYLSAEASALAFFDDEIPVNVKRNMVDALKGDGLFGSVNKIEIDVRSNIMNLEISDFVSKHSKRFFERFNLPSNFLEQDPQTWEINEQYKHCLEIVKKIKVVNDAAERGIKLIQEYNSKLTKDEEQKNFIIQVVTSYRKRFPDLSKATMSLSF